MENWKPIKGYENSYQISNLGRVKRMSYKRNFCEKIMKIGSHRDGYSTIVLCKDGISKTKKIHRLVAEAFLENKNLYPEVNHKDEDKKNNDATNLEWVTIKFNRNYGSRNSKIRSKVSKPVGRFSKEGVLLERFECTLDADKKGYCSSNISKCCAGKLKTHGKYIWKYL